MKRKGNAAIILVVAFTALLGFTALALDIGNVYINKVKLSNALDAAALSACLELPENPSKASIIAYEYLEKNGIDPSRTTISISDNNKQVEIEGDLDVEYFFAKAIGLKGTKVYAKTRAVIGPVKSVKGGLRPFAVVAYDFSYGDRVTLKEDAGDGYHGNYGVVALGGFGANVFRINALYGYNGKISVGDLIDTEPGNMAGVVNDIRNYINSDPYTFQNFNRDSRRLWTLPLVNTLEVDGRKKVLVVGFAEFFVEDVQKKSGKAEITGRFIRYVRSGEIDFTLEDTGLYAAKLIR